MRIDPRVRSLLRRVGGRIGRLGEAGERERVQAHRDAILLPSFNVRSSVGGGAVRVGAESMVGATFVFESAAGEVSIGERCFVSGGTQFIARTSITVGNDVTIAWGCWFYDHNSHSLDWRERANDIRKQNAAYRRGEDFIADKDWSVVGATPIVLRDKCWIGFDSVVLAGVTIGEGAIVGARSVVREDVPDWTVVAGNPATVVRRIDPARRARRGDRGRDQDDRSGEGT